MNSTRLRKFATRQLGFFYQLYYRYAHSGQSAGLILFHPEFPDRRAVILRIAGSLGFNLTTNPQLACDLAFFWKDATFRAPSPILKECSQKSKVVNLGCTDISKSRVDESFHEAFGYRSEVDPLTFNGTCVRKSEINAQHDGAVIECPVAQREEGFIYQKLLQRVHEEKWVVDYRVAVFGNTLTAFCTRYKPIEDRFGKSIRQELANLHDYVSEDEQAKILKFCRVIGLDYGEIDMIRDEKDERLYLLDANNTPFWPPPSFNISQSDREAILDQYRTAFRKEFLEPAANVAARRE